MPASDPSCTALVSCSIPSLVYGRLSFPSTVVGRPRVRCLLARLTTRVVRSPTLPPTFKRGHSRPMQLQQTNVVPPCQMSQPPRKLDYPNSKPCLGLLYLRRRARRGQFWTSSAARSTRPWMTKKFTVGFLTWAATFQKRQDEDNKPSGHWSKTRSLAGHLLSRRRTLIGNMCSAHRKRKL